jgi:hypothetical protein
MSYENEKDKREIEEIYEKYEEKKLDDREDYKKYEDKRFDDRQDDKRNEDKRFDDRQDDKRNEDKRFDDRQDDKKLDDREDYNYNKSTSVYDIILNNHSIKGEKGSQYVVFKLSNNQSIIGPVNNIYTKNNIHKENNAVLKNTKYIGLDQEASYVAFGCNYQNSILYFKVEKDSVFYVSKYNIVAYTDNILFESDMIIKCVSGDYGYVWIASYGSYEKVELKESESVELNSGMLVMSTSLPIEQNMSYTLTGPCYFIFQSKNIKNIYKQISQNVPVVQPAATKKGFFSTFFSGGGTMPDVEEKRIRTITRYI